MTKILYYLNIWDSFVCIYTYLFIFLRIFMIIKYNNLSVKAPAENQQNQGQPWRILHTTHIISLSISMATSPNTRFQCTKVFEDSLVANTFKPKIHMMPPKPGSLTLLKYPLLSFSPFPALVPATASSLPIFSFKDRRLLQPNVSFMTVWEITL